MTADDGPVTGAPVTGWVDSHCHLASLSEEPAVVLGRAKAAGVTSVVCVGTDLASSCAALELAGRHPEVAATVGLHPHDATSLHGQWDALEALAGDPRVVAVGETGFDLHYEYSPRDAEEDAFRAQIRLAHAQGLALVIHTREAWDATFAVLAEEGVPARTVFHCFTGGVPEARRALDLGAYLSFSGIVSFPNARDVQDAARHAPLDRVLVETDAPYLAPVPHRGRPNEPAWVADVGAALAAVVGRPLSEVAAATRAGSAAVFGHPR